MLVYPQVLAPGRRPDRPGRVQVRSHRGANNASLTIPRLTIFRGYLGQKIEVNCRQAFGRLRRYLGIISPAIQGLPEMPCDEKNEYVHNLFL